MIIYQITNEVNGKFYIGKTTKTPEERFQKHLYESRYNRNGSYLYKSIRKYGEEHFTITILESQVDETNLDERERYWIRTLNPQYNLTKGGEGGDTSKSPKWIEGMKNRKKPSNGYRTFGMLGKKQSQKWRDSIKKSNSKPVSIEGVVYPSITEGQKKYPGIKVRYRIDSPNYPDWFRLS
jgi:group I intron endonuclease